MNARSPVILLGVAMLTCLAGTAAAAPVARTSDLQFSTRGQSLFGPTGGATRTESLRFDVLNDQQTLNHGAIVNTQVPLSVATLQAIWQIAMNTCIGVKYSIVVAGVTIATFSPSETECINGEIRRNYCVAPPQLGWDACLDIGDNRQTYVRDLGPGIGQKPTQPTTRPYDLGAIFSMSSDMRVGFEGSYSYDLGSVDVDYAAHAQLQFDKDSAAPGDVVTITTSYTDRDPYVMNSRYPSFELALDMYAYARMALDADYAGVDQSNGKQVRTKRNLYSIDSRNNPAAIDGFMPFTNGSERLFDVRLDSSGVTARVLGAETKVESRFETDLTFPFGSTETPGKKAPHLTWPLAFSLADFAFSVPRLDTPAAPGFSCGDCVPLRNVIVNGALTNTTPVGARQLIGGITDGNGIVLPLVNDGQEDVDLARVDIDLDAITIAAGVPLGAIVSDPIGVFEAEVNLLDLDFATFISADQTLSFRPNLELELTFSTPTEVRLAGETDYTLTTSRVIKVGDTVMFRQPATAVTVTPVFTLRDNAFSNVTQLKISNAIQETLGQVKVGGMVGDLMGTLIGQDPNFAMLQLTPTLYEPKSIWSNDTAPWALQGFADQPVQAVTVTLAGTGGGGSGGGGGGGTGGGSGGGGGGGGSLDVLALCGLLSGLIALLRSRRYCAARR